MATFNKDQLVDLLKDELNYKELKKELDDLRKASTFHWLEEGLDVIILAVKTIEKIVTETGQGKVKRDAVVSFIDGCISFGRFNPLEAIDGPIIGMGVDMAVRFLKKFGLWSKE